MPNKYGPVMVDATRRYSNLDNHLELARTTADTIRRSRQVDRPRQPTKTRRIAQRLDEAIIQQLVRDYGDGIPTTQLTGRYGLAKGTVLKLLREHGVTMRGTRRPG